MSPQSFFYADSDTKSNKTYAGGCHCGKTKYTVSIPALDTIPVNACNCSICTANGYLMVFPFREDVVFESASGDSGAGAGGGMNDLGSYRFRSKVMEHRFCKDCGTSVLVDYADQPPIKGVGDMSKYLGINVRTFKDIDIDKLTLRNFDGKHAY